MQEEKMTNIELIQTKKIVYFYLVHYVFPFFALDLRVLWHNLTISLDGLRYGVNLYYISNTHTKSYQQIIKDVIL